MSGPAPVDPDPFGEDYPAGTPWWRRNLPLLLAVSILAAVALVAALLRGPV